MTATRNLQIFRLFRARRAAFVAALSVLGIGLQAGCSNDSQFTQTATIENVSRVNSVYALTGTSASLPAAYQLSQERFVRPSVLFDGSLNFELAFDMDAQGVVKLLPARAVVPQPPASAPVIGLLKLPVVYEQILRAPEAGYVLDSAAVAAVGQTWLLKLLTASCVFGDPYYAKLTIDSIIVAERRIVVRTLANRNCGFRSLDAGLPTN